AADGGGAGGVLSAGAARDKGRSDGGAAVRLTFQVRGGMARCGFQGGVNHELDETAVCTAADLRRTFARNPGTPRRKDRGTCGRWHVQQRSGGGGAAQVWERRFSGGRRAHGLAMGACREPLDGYSVRVAVAAQESGFYCRGGADAGAGDRGEHRVVQRNRRGSVAPAAISRS